MNKSEILNIVNEPSKHIHVVKIDGKDSIVYSSKFVELLELIPKMYTKSDMVDVLEGLKKEIIELPFPQKEPEYMQGYSYCQMNILVYVIQEKINLLKGVGMEVTIDKCCTSRETYTVDSIP